AVVDDRVVPAVRGEDVGEGAAGLQVGGHDGAVDALPVIRERRRAALVEDEVPRDVPAVLGRDAVAVVDVAGEDVVEVTLVDRSGASGRAADNGARDGHRRTTAGREQYQ